jgi:myo-inositol 2-dehydrogenase / D-chiro-inositol 1-dehydrogenase
VGEKGSVSLRSPVYSEINLNLCQRTRYPEDWRPRFAEAYRRQNQAWIRSIKTGVPAGASAWDGYAATLVAEAGLAALVQGSTVTISPAAKASIYP